MPSRGEAWPCVRVVRHWGTGGTGADLPSSGAALVGTLTLAGGGRRVLGVFPTRRCDMGFRVSLDMFRGPLDLLLYLVRKHEVDIADIPIAAITEQYLDYLAVLKELDIDGVAEFVALASTLLEIKAQQLLPAGEGEEVPVEDPRAELVQRLLQYKEYRDAAAALEERSRRWQQQYARRAGEDGGSRHDPAEEPLQEVELWDLVSAFARVLRAAELAQPSSIVYDDTPIQVYMARILDRVVAVGRLPLGGLFEPGMHKSHLVGIFLALLELVRSRRVTLEQECLFGEIWISPGPAAGEPLEPVAPDACDSPLASNQAAR